MQSKSIRGTAAVRIGTSIGPVSVALWVLVVFSSSPSPSFLLSPYATLSRDDTTTTAVSAEQQQQQHKKKKSRNLATGSGERGTLFAKDHSPSAEYHRIGRTSFRTFDKEQHAKRIFNLPPELTSDRTKDNLDFVVAGFPKCGTTYLKNYFSREDDISMFAKERCAIFKQVEGRQRNSDMSAFVQFLQQLEATRKHDDLLITTTMNTGPTGRGRGQHEHEHEHGRQKIAFKCPSTVTEDIFDHLFSTYFPETDLIIGIRHPVDYFRSFYNFKIRQKPPGHPIPLANELIGSKCHLYDDSICTDGAKFALPLAKLGKTDLGTEEIQSLSSMVYPSDPHYEKKQDAITTYLSTMAMEQEQKPKLGRVFLYALEQIKDKDDERRSQFVQDLSTFIGLDHTIQEQMKSKRSNEIRHEVDHAVAKNYDDDDEDDDDEDDGEYNTNSRRRRRRRQLRKYYADYRNNHWDYQHADDLLKEEARARHNKLMIDICEPLYDELRRIMVEDGKKTAAWIRDYFLDGDGVVVSQRIQFEKILDTFSVDPCKGRDARN